MLASKLSAFLARRRIAPVRVTEDDGPFGYTYVAVAAVPGLHLADDVGDPVDFCEFPQLGATVFFTRDWDAYCLHMDRSSAIGELLLTAFSGKKRFRRLSKYWHRLLAILQGEARTFRSRLAGATAASRERRHKRYGSSGCYLVYHASAKLAEPLNLRATRRVGDIGFGFDTIPAGVHREVHRRALNTSIVALSLSLVETSGSPEAQIIGDSVYINGANDLKIYSKTVTMGAAAIVTSSASIAATAHKAKSYVQPMFEDDKIETAISLFVQSHTKPSDNLRSYIPAWSALELLVNRLSRLVWPTWQELLKKDGLPEWDKDLTNVLSEDYRMRDRFFSVACVLNLDSAGDDVQMFIRINRMRSGYYHRMDVREENLPTDDARRLFRDYLRLGLSYATSGQDDGP